MRVPGARVFQRTRLLAVAAILAAGLYVALVGSASDGLRIRSSAWLALGRRPLDAQAVRLMEVSLAVRRSYPEEADAGSWLKPVASLILKGHDRADGCWSLRLLLETAHVQEEEAWLLRGPSCVPEHNAPPPARILPRGLSPN